MMSKDKMISEIYYRLWRSADFEADFEEDWKAVYKYFKRHDADLLPELAIEIVYEWMTNWDKQTNFNKEAE